MSDIVQLKEDGVAKYLKTHADAIDGVDGKLVKATGNETILGTKNFQDGIQIAGQSVAIAAATTYERIIDYWDGTGVYLSENQSVTIPNIETVDEIVFTLSRYNANYSGIIYSFPVTPNITKLKYDMMGVAWEGSASGNSTIGVKRISLSKSGTSLIITGDPINTMNDANKKFVFREIGVRRRK